MSKHSKEVPPPTTTQNEGPTAVITYQTPYGNFEMKSNQSVEKNRAAQASFWKFARLGARQQLKDILIKQQQLQQPK